MQWRGYLFCRQRRQVLSALCTQRNAAQEDDRNLAGVTSLVACVLRILSNYYRPDTCTFFGGSGPRLGVEALTLELYLNTRLRHEVEIPRRRKVAPPVG